MDHFLSFLDSADSSFYENYETATMFYFISTIRTAIQSTFGESSTEMPTPSALLRQKEK